MVEFVRPVKPVRQERGLTPSPRIRRHGGQKRGLLTVALTALVVSSASTLAVGAPTPHDVQRQIGTLTLICATAPGLHAGYRECRAVIRTPWR